MGLFRTFGFAFGVTIAVLVGTAVIASPQDVAIVAILGVLEISLSFDNAVVNATVLQRMAPFWQRLFLTLGILIAVFGMRLLFPLIVVSLSGHVSFSTAIDLALNDPRQYADKLTAAHPAIAAFGGIFLLMIFLDFIFEEREITWLTPLENAVAKIGQLEALSSMIALVVLLGSALTYASDHEGQVLVSGVAGLATYLVVNGLSSLFEADEEETVDELAAGPPPGGGAPVKLPRGATRAGLFLFLYLEVLDASFSFDGVVGAFAITDKIFVIAAGLGIGAMYIRSLTVFLVRKGTLSEYIYLEHGAHYAIGALAVLLFVSITTQVPELVTGLIGVGFIALAFLSSLIERRGRNGTGGVPQTGSLEVAAAG